jgi:dihydrofolate reductase
MPVYAIMGMSENDVIGVGNKLPWQIPYDLKWFKMNTFGGAIIMGRKTWESLPKKPLPGRINIVLTRSPTREYGAFWCNSIKNALNIAKLYSNRTYIIGGAEIFHQSLLLNVVDILIMTRVHTKILSNAATYAVLPLYKYKFWKSNIFQHKHLKFHFEMYIINNKKGV